MSFSSEQFFSRLNNLEDSQESIGNASKWLLSQYREAPQVAEFWKNYMLKKDVNTRRKLLAIYLVNHVVQQAKAKKIGQFQTAFGNVATEVLKDVYPVLPRDLKKKVRRVCDIWKDRGIFSKGVLDSIQTCLDSDSPASNDTHIPSQLKSLVASFEKLNKFGANTRALKLRFDKVFEALDPSSVVYEENFKTVTKIGQAAKDTTSQSIQLREAFIGQLQSLLEEEMQLLDEEKNAVAEIDMAISSTQAPDLNQTANYDDDILPTYEAGNDDDDDDEDGDNTTSNGSDLDDVSDTETNKLESNDNTTATTKRQNDTTSSDTSENKRQKLSSEEDVDHTVQEYEPESFSSNQTTSHNEGTSGVTSNIQDLLSKLAN